MRVCDSCGQENRSGARFCWNCATPLVSFRPSEDDRQWLAASLALGARAEGVPAVAGATGASLAPGVAEEERMDQQGPTLFAGRYELPAGEPSGPLSVVDTTPWRRCWACGSTANEEGDAFCNDCGAALERRSYSATLSEREAPSGAALVPTIADEAARAVLPELADQVEDGDRVLTLLHDSGRGPVAVPLDETAALTVGADLARLVAYLHSQSMALGTVEPSDLELVPGGAARLRAVANLRRVPLDELSAAVQSDLTALAELLEELTATPRTTQRLSEDEAAQAIVEGEAGLAAVLREVRTGTLGDATALAERLDAILAERTNPAPLAQVVGAQTDTGMVRDHNEDSYLTIRLGLDNNNRQQAWGVYIVSDGMGGHAAGEVASGLAVRAAADLMLGEYLAGQVQPEAVYNDAEAGELVRRAVLRANERVVEESEAQGNDMGATLTMALVVGDRVTVANVGDSRTYLFKDGKLKRVSKDHSLVQRLVDLGQIGDDDVYTHPQRNAVLRSLGDKAEVAVDLFSERVRPGDALFLCSDGQWEMTRDPEMEQLIAEAADPQAACDALVAAANKAGGEDNITAVLVRFV